MKPKEEQNSVLDFKNPLNTPKEVDTNPTQKESDSNILDKLTFLNGKKVRGGKHTYSTLSLNGANPFTFNA